MKPPGFLSVVGWLALLSGLVDQFKAFSRIVNLET